MSVSRVLSVGQCGVDHGQLSRFLRDAFGAVTEPADSVEDALEALKGGQFGLVLVNRVIDLDGSSGLDLIRSIRSDPDMAALPVMLVSNYPDAQAAAVALGAAPGFGKADIGKAKARDALGAVLKLAEAR